MHGVEGASLRLLIDIDRIAAVRRTVLISIPMNLALSATAFLVAAVSGQFWPGLVWLAASCAINVPRIALCRAPLPSPGEAPLDAAFARRLRRHSLLHQASALASGLVWAFLPVLSDGYTSPEALFYLTVCAGITAGAVVHGFAYAWVPIAFISPPLLSGFVCLIYAGGFLRYALAALIALYLVALIRASFESQAFFIDATRLKHQANALTASVATARDAAATRAARDSLTGLLNRAGFADTAERRLDAPGASLCLMLLDLDGFKSINDAYGHKMGDAVLIEVARRLREAAPVEAALARLGGDEFALLYVPVPSQPAEDLSARLIAAISRPLEPLDPGRIGVSVGIYHGAAGDDLDEMRARADAALYAAKGRGRNRSCVFDDELHALMTMRRDVERDLAGALAAQQLDIWFQPILADGGARLDGFEALLRWRHPAHGAVSPVEIVAVAALAGLSERLLAFVADRACDMAQRLAALSPAPIRIALNVSPREAAQIAVDDIILAALTRRALSPSRLEIEITEETAVDVEAVSEKLRRLANAGARIAIDDFGVGYSSIASMRALRADRIKIDRSFIETIVTSEPDRLLVAAILRLGEALDVEIVAEGVETQEIALLLGKMGAKLMQGYHFARPMPADEALEWAAQRAPLCEPASRDIRRA